MIFNEKRSRLYSVRPYLPDYVQLPVDGPQENLRAPKRQAVAECDFDIPAQAIEEQFVFQEIPIQNGAFAREAFHVEHHKSNVGHFKLSAISDQLSAAANGIGGELAAAGFDALAAPVANGYFHAEVFEPVAKLPRFLSRW